MNGNITRYKNNTQTITGIAGTLLLRRFLKKRKYYLLVNLIKGTITSSKDTPPCWKVLR
jgi:hypothetical protein